MMLYFNLKLIFQMILLNEITKIKRKICVSFFTNIEAIPQSCKYTPEVLSKL